MQSHRSPPGACSAAAAFALVLVSLSPTTTHGQIQDTGLWLAMFSQGELNLGGLDTKDARWWFDANSRFLGDQFDVFQGIVRPGIGRQLNDEQSIWVGYAWIGESLPDLDFHENRIWEQWGLTRKTGQMTIQVRSRLEQRFVSVGNQAGWRFRQMVRLQKPVAKDSDLLFVAWDEIFFHLNDTDWGARTGYNQNRVFIGMGRTPKSKHRRRTEIGYLYQQINIAEDGADLSNHILNVNIFFSP